MPIPSGRTARWKFESWLWEHKGQRFQTKAIAREFGVTPSQITRIIQELNANNWQIEQSIPRGWWRMVATAQDKWKGREAHATQDQR